MVRVRTVGVWVRTVMARVRTIDVRLGRFGFGFGWSTGLRVNPSVKGAKETQLPTTPDTLSARFCE